MTYQEAKSKLQELANGKSSQIEYSTFTFRSGGESSQVRMYIEDAGHTPATASYETALALMADLLNAVEIDLSEQEPQVS